MVMVNPQKMTFWTKNDVVFRWVNGENVTNHNDGVNFKFWKSRNQFRSSPKLGEGKCIL